jgi:hypothetical protein
MPPDIAQMTSFPSLVSTDHAILGIRLRLINMETTVCLPHPSYQHAID